MFGHSIDVEFLDLNYVYFSINVIQNKIPPAI